MDPRQDLYQLLYLCEPARGSDVRGFGEVVRAMRQCHLAHGITGALLFDGERFCQLLEGPPETVHRLMRETLAHHALGAIDIRHDAPLCPPARRQPGWRSGYCGASDLDRVIAAAAPSGSAAVDAFIGLVETAETE